MPSIEDADTQRRSSTTISSPSVDSTSVGRPVSDPTTGFTDAAAPGRATEVRTTYTGRFAPDTLIAGLVGLLSLIIGLIVLVRAGLSSPLSKPVVSVLGFTHTAMLGIIEVAVGLFLLTVASTRSRSGAAFGGLVMVVGGVVGVAQYRSFADTLALERGWAWVILLAGVLVAATALLLPRVARRSSTVRQRGV
jgi:hypothetical protein